MNEALGISSIFISFFALLVAIVALVLNLAMKFSTHKIEFKPLKYEEFKEEDDTKDEDDDKLLAEALNLQRKKKRSEDPLDTILETANF